MSWQKCLLHSPRTLVEPEWRVAGSSFHCSSPRTCTIDDKQYCHALQPRMVRQSIDELQHRTAPKRRRNPLQYRKASTTRGEQLCSSNEHSPERAVVSPRGHDAILIHSHAVHNSLLILQHVVQELTLHSANHLNKVHLGTVSNCKGDLHQRFLVNRPYKLLTKVLIPHE